MIYVDSSAVPYRTFDPAVFRGRFELALAQREIPEREREPLFERYAAFNAAITGSAEAVTDPLEFLDLAYMQRYETARYVLGLDGHGSQFGNLRVLLNTANGKFYPAFNRDDAMGKLNLSTERTPELQINMQYGERALPLFQYAATSDRLRQQIYRGIYEFIKAGDGGPADDPGRPRPDCRRPFVGGLPFVGEVRPAGATQCKVGSTPPPDIFNETASSNVESLRTYLETSAPEFSARLAPERLSLTIQPNSMSALRVETLEIGGDPGQGPVRVDVTEMRGGRESPVLASHTSALRSDRTLDLGSALVDARFFTGLDLTRLPPPLPHVNVRWIAGLEEAERQRLERRLGLLSGYHMSPQTWRYLLADTSPARMADIVGDDAVEDTHGINRHDSSLPDLERYRSPRMTRAQRLHELIFSFSRPLPGLLAESIALSFINTVTGQEVEARRVPTVEAPAGEAFQPASAFAGGNDQFEDWAVSHETLSAHRSGPREITLARGAYDLLDDLVFPDGHDVVIEGGTDLRLGPGVVLLIRGGLTLAGSAPNPVTIRPIDADKPFGTVAVLGDGSQRTTIRHLDLSGGSDAWVRGVRFSGALSIHYQHEVEVSHASIQGNHGEAGLSVMYARGRVADSVFTGNRGSQINLEYFDGVVRRNRLAGSVPSGRKGSGLDVTGSRLVATNNEFSGFMETGVRVGESGEALFAANTFSDNALAMAVTDLSTMYLHEDNLFATNDLDVSAFLQKPYFGGGTVVLAGDAGPAGLSLVTDRLSTIAYVSHAAIERLRPTEIPPADVVSSLTDLSVVSRR